MLCDRRLSQVKMRHKQMHVIRHTNSHLFPTYACVIFQVTQKNQFQLSYRENKWQRSHREELSGGKVEESCESSDHKNKGQIFDQRGYREANDRGYRGPLDHRMGNRTDDGQLTCAGDNARGNSGIASGRYSPHRSREDGSIRTDPCDPTHQSMCG